MGSRVGDKVKSERGYNVHTAGQYAKKKKSGVKTENNRSAKTPVPQRGAGPKGKSAAESSSAFDTCNGSIDYD